MGTSSLNYVFDIYSLWKWSGTNGISFIKVIIYNVQIYKYKSHDY